MSFFKFWNNHRLKIESNLKISNEKLSELELIDWISEISSISKRCSSRNFWLQIKNELQRFATIKFCRNVQPCEMFILMIRLENTKTLSEKNWKRSNTLMQQFFKINLNISLNQKSQHSRFSQSQKMISHDLNNAFAIKCMKFKNAHIYSKVRDLLNEKKMLWKEKWQEIRSKNIDQFSISLIVLLTRIFWMKSWQKTARIINQTKEMKRAKKITKELITINT
jgi:hypothetical protein